MIRKLRMMVTPTSSFFFIKNARLFLLKAELKYPRGGELGILENLKNQFCFEHLKTEYNRDGEEGKLCTREFILVRSYP